MSVHNVFMKARVTFCDIKFNLSSNVFCSNVNIEFLFNACPIANWFTTSVFVFAKVVNTLRGRPDTVIFRPDIIVIRCLYPIPQIWSIFKIFRLRRIANCLSLSRSIYIDCWDGVSMFRWTKLAYWSFVRNWPICALISDGKVCAAGIGSGAIWNGIPTICAGGELGSWICKSPPSMVSSPSRGPWSGGWEKNHGYKHQAKIWVRGLEAEWEEGIRRNFLEFKI